MESLSWFLQIYLNWTLDCETMKIFIKNFRHAFREHERDCIVNLPIVRIDPNSHPQHHQPIATPMAVRAQAIATYLALVVVETKWIHEYTTERNVDNLWWNLVAFTLNSMFHTLNNTALRGVYGRARCLTQWNRLALLEPFCLIAFIAPSTTFVIWNFLIYLAFCSLPTQLLFRYHILNSPNEIAKYSRFFVTAPGSLRKINFFN